MTITAAWLRRGYTVFAYDPGGIRDQIEAGKEPIREPGLLQTLRANLRTGQLKLSSSSSGLRQCPSIFIAEDTTVNEDDSSDLTHITRALDVVRRGARDGALVIVSSQLPVGTARELRAALRAQLPGSELVHVPENLRLGQAVARYLNPGYVVIGSASADAGARADALYRGLTKVRLHMSLESAEMAKHAINSFLATSISLANHWSDVASVVGADYERVKAALAAEPRIGRHAYINPGLGFSGGTLGRDLHVLQGINRSRLGGTAPLFAEVLQYNTHRREQLVTSAARVLPSGARIGVLGITYKPGTSTLRRSMPLEVVRGLAEADMHVHVQDPSAHWSEVELPSGIRVFSSPYEAAVGADLLMILTPWPEYRDLDLRKLGSVMRSRRLVDPALLLRSRARELTDLGFSVSWSVAIAGTAGG